MMKKGLLFLAVAAVAGLAIVQGLRLVQKTSNAAVTALLPRETVALFHVPDLNATRTAWQTSDIYQLYAEPEVQDFLKRPLEKVPRPDSFAQTLHDFEELDPKDFFVAVTAVANERDAKLVGGFRFRGSQDNAERVVNHWRSSLPGSGPRATVDYEQHKIETVATGLVSVASVYDGQWFFISNNLDELKAVLDRADGRAKDAQTFLAADENFRTANAKMPGSYAALIYVQPKVLADRLAAAAPNQKNSRAILEQIRALCATTRFDHGKLHDTLYLAMPRQPPDAQLTRATITLGSKETFLFAATLLNLSRQLTLFDPSSAGSFLGPDLQKIGRAFAATGLSPDEWNAIFGSEMGFLADWPQNMHWPAVLAAFPVKDPARARKVVGPLARNLDDDGAWTETDKDGVHYVSMPYSTPLLSIRPTIAVSDKMMVVGLDLHAVEAAMQRSGSGASQLSDSATYKATVHNVPEPTNFSAYLDLPLLYTRLDSALRPMLMMSAAFIPWMSEYVDAGKLPAVETVTRHLSPIVSSTRYEGDGYVSESVGPITLNQAGLGTIALAVGFGAWRQQQLSGGAGSLFGLPPGGGAASPGPSGGNWRGQGPNVPATPTSPVPGNTP